MSQSLVLLKPDAVRRGLIGRILQRLEDTGLRIRNIKMYDPPDYCHILKHYESTDEWLFNVGKKTIEDFVSAGLTLEEVKRDYGVTDEMGIGRVVKNRLIEYLTSGTVVAVIVEGNMAIEKVRLMIGHTIPAMAAPGSIRGDYGTDNAAFAAASKRSIENLIHASDSPETAEKEIDLWFGSGC
mgnify:CR=1 FL=1